MRIETKKKDGKEGVIKSLTAKIFGDSDFSKVCLKRFRPNNTYFNLFFQVQNMKLKPLLDKDFIMLTDFPHHKLILSETCREI